MAGDATRTRTFTVPAGTVINGFTIPETISRTLTYSPSEMNSSQAQKAARRAVAAAIGDRFGIAAPVSKLQAATARVNKPSGKARGGRIPESVKVLGFRTIANKTPKGKSTPGITTYTKGNERGRIIANGFDTMDALVREAFRRHPGGRVQVAAFGWPPADSPSALQSPKRRARNHPRGIWKRGDVVPKARQWGSTVQVASLDQWERIYGTPERFMYGSSGEPDARGTHTGTEIDADRMTRVDVIVREGRA